MTTYREQYDRHKELVAGLSEDEANTLFHMMARKFGWAGGFMMRGDYESQWEQMYDEPFTDEVWDAIQGTYWHKNMADCTDTDWYRVDDSNADAHERIYGRKRLTN